MDYKMHTAVYFIESLMSKNAGNVLINNMK